MKRRHFITQGATAATAFSILPSHVFGKSLGHIAPSDKINLACVGIGHRGGQISNTFGSKKLTNIVALCDVDMGAEHTLNVIKKNPKAKQFQDFREMFDKMSDSIDAVSIGTPDFSHFPITMKSMALGKHVYVEKPMARTFNEVELMIQGAKKYGVATQMGNQGHSEANYFQFKSWVDAGIIKDVTAMTAHMNSARRWHGWDTNMKTLPDGQPVPETLDWDTWLGTAQYHEYNKDYHHGQWRCWYDFGMGALGDWGAHIMDTAHQFLELGLPYEVNPKMIEGYNPLFFPQSSTLEFKFPKRKNLPAMTITWYDGVNNQPPLPEGYGTSELDPNIPPPSAGSIQQQKLNPGKIIYGKDLTLKGGSHGSTLSIILTDKAKDIKLPEVPESPSDHFENFLLACKGEEKTRSPFEVAGPLSQVFNLGVIAQRLNQKLEFDRETKQITNNVFANALLAGQPPRKGWEEYYLL
ncbi:MAG: oxidoreductase [Phycisphaeraceae bacterium]|nr:oxidoreductase [Phycisphaeraceae bacterium]